MTPSLDALARALSGQGLVVPPPGGTHTPRCDVLEWAASGAMALTGHEDGPPLAPPGPVLDRLAAAAAVARSAAGELGADLEVDPAALVAGRARHRPLARRGRRSAGGRCALLCARGGWVALNLARPEDTAALGSVLGVDLDAAVFGTLGAPVAARDAGELVDLARLLGVPAARLPTRRPVVASPVRASRLGAPAPRRPRAPLVVDLSAMWAGPLIAHLLGRAGFAVVKVEDPARPDGSRLGDPGLFAELHEGHDLVALELASAAGRSRLADLLGRADVVIEASRPRVLHQLGFDPARLVAARPGVTWVSVTGYGRRGPLANAVAFGDDAAVAAGLVAADAAGDPVFCADALADPVTGLYGAAAALVSQAAGGGHLIEVPMARAAAYAGGGRGCARRHRTERHGDGWVVTCGTEHQAVVRRGPEVCPSGA